MELQTLWRTLETSSVGDYVAASGWAFPLIETLHVIAIAAVVGTIAVVDLRLLGLASRDASVTILSRDALRLTWGAFALAVVTGLLLFASRATSYTINPYFQAKMVLLALAGVNMALFHLVTWRSVGSWDRSATVPMAAKVAGGLSLAFWVMVVFCGRVIGFTLGVYV